MGNRAAIVFSHTPSGGSTEISPTIYVHWNGGPESIYAFVDFMANRMGVRSECPYYIAARLTQLIGMHFSSCTTKPRAMIDPKIVCVGFNNINKPNEFGETDSHSLSLGLHSGPSGIDVQSIRTLDDEIQADHGVYLFDLSDYRNTERYVGTATRLNKTRKGFATSKAVAAEAAAARRDATYHAITLRLEKLFTAQSGEYEIL